MSCHWWPDSFVEWYNSFNRLGDPFRTCNKGWVVVLALDNNVAVKKSLYFPWMCYHPTGELAVLLLPLVYLEWCNGFNKFGDSSMTCNKGWAVVIAQDNNTGVKNSSYHSALLCHGTGDLVVLLIPLVYFEWYNSFNKLGDPYRAFNKSWAVVIARDNNARVKRSSYHPALL